MIFRVDIFLLLLIRSLHIISYGGGRLSSSSKSSISSPENKLLFCWGELVGGLVGGDPRTFFQTLKMCVFSGNQEKKKEEKNFWPPPGCVCMGEGEDLI